MNLNEVTYDLQTLRIQGRHRFWYPFMRKYGVKTLAEIGVRTGRNFKRLIDHRPKLAVAVDCWIDDGVPGRNDQVADQTGLDNQYNDFVSLVAGKPYVKICRGYSFDVVKEFPDNYFDFVYIDADHTYEGCSRDILDWWPKVKSGGFLTGDDFRTVTYNKARVKFGVIQAVNEHVIKYNLPLILMPRWNWAVIKP